MAINVVVLDMLAALARNFPAPRRLVCLGYPDMLVTEPQLAKVCGAEVAGQARFRDDSESILRWHRLGGRMERVAETSSVFQAMGIEADFVDIAATRGREIVLDLNQPLPAALAGQYDLVYDGGTLEHCFNVGQVMRNIAALAKTGGFILHVNPLNYYNHGFFNFNPTFYHDWYAQTGNQVVGPCYAMFGPVLEPRLVPLEPTHPFREAPARAVVVVAARKLADTPAGWPMQSKYRDNPELKS